MPVSDFECQIARGQIGRYVEGGALSPQAMVGLEEHLAECPACKALVTERRTALLGSLSGGASGSAVPAKAVVEMPVENPLVAALREKQKAAPDEPPKTAVNPAKAAPRYATKKPAVGKAPTPLGKPLALAALLAVVLLGMSRVSQFVGAPASRASTSFASEPPPVKTVETTKAPTGTAKSAATESGTTPDPRTPETKAQPASISAAPKTEATKPVAAKPAPKTEKTEALKRVAAKKPRFALAKPIATKPAAPKPVVRRTVRKAAKRRAVKNAVRHTARKSRSSVRVYGLDGRPLN